MKQIATIVTILFLSFSTKAQVFVNHAATGNNDGSSWTDAYKDIQTAIDSTMAGEELWIVAGTYIPAANASPDLNFFGSTKALSFYGGFDGTETTLDQRDYNNNITIFSGDVNGDDVDDNFSILREDNARHVLRIAHTTGTTIIDGITIQNGNALNTDIPPGADFSLYRGGGVEILGDGLIQNCLFKQCSGNAGAALWTFGNAGGSDLTVENCIFQNNNSQQGAFVILSMLNPIISNSLFENNFAGTFGGGITLGNTNGNVSNCIFQNNETPTTTIGGGVFIFQNSGNVVPSPTIEIDNCEFIENIAGAGAGICFNNFSPGSIIFIDSCEFIRNESNFANNNGGAGVTIQNIFNNFGGGISSLSAEISNCNFEENESYAGGAAFLFCSQSTIDLQISNTEFTGNIADTNGGGIVASAIDSEINAEITNSVFTDNTAIEGSAVNSGTFTNVSLSNVLAYQNNGGPAFVNNGNMSFLNSTLLENSSGLINYNSGEMEIQNTILSNVDLNNIGNESGITSLGGNLSSDLSLENVFIGMDNYTDFNNELPTLDMNLVPQNNSLCLDAGNPTNVAATEDLAGEDRIQGSQIDIGAFESGFNVGLSTLAKSKVNVYPNPFLSELHLSDIEAIEQIRLLNASGNAVAEFAPSKTLVIGEQLPVGVYFLELTYPSFKSVEKIEKVK